MIERVDRHVVQEHMRHLLAKATEVRPQKEIGVETGHLSDHALSQGFLRRDCAGQVTPILDDRERFSHPLGHLAQFFSVGHREGHRLFHQHIAARLEGRLTRRDMGFGHGAIENEVCSGRLHRCLEGCAHERLVQLEFGGAGCGRLLKQIDQANHFDALRIVVSQGRQPWAAHAAASDQNCFMFYVHLFFGWGYQGAKRELLTTRHL
jgi:hypothetical protein